MTPNDTKPIETATPALMSEAAGFAGTASPKTGGRVRSRLHEVRGRMAGPRLPAEMRAGEGWGGTLTLLGGWLLLVFAQSR
jgi:hypothetical protein